MSTDFGTTSSEGLSGGDSMLHAAAVGINVDELVARFSTADYTVFVLLLAVSLAIGLYYGIAKRHEMRTSEGYLLGGRQMGVLPTALSLIASFMSAITLLGTPAEIYQNGAVYVWIGLSYIIVMPAAAYLYMPVFFDLGVISAYQYLEMRFHRVVRQTGAIIFSIQMCIYMAIVVYAPSLALSQVTGINVYVSVVLIFIVCVAYTALGGMKAVLWTDTVQVIIMFGAIIAVIIKGTSDVGGLSTVWQVAQDGGRLDFSQSFNLNPGIRHTFWTLVLGGYFTWITIYGVNQAQVQRYLCVPTKRQASAAILINGVGLLLLLGVCSYAGLVIFARYRFCDPIKSGTVSTPDQLFPLFVMDTMGEVPGVAGLFVAGIFSGALSTVSSGINSLAAVTLQDFVIPSASKEMTPERQAYISKLLAVAFGLLAFVLVFVAEQLGDILQAALSVFGMVGGPLLGMFTLGLFLPWANWKGAMTGTFTALVFIFWIGVGVQVEKSLGNISSTKLPVSVDQCPRMNLTTSATTNATTSITTTVATTNTDNLSVDEPLGIYYLSYMYYSLVSCMVVCVVGMLTSWATGFNDPTEMDPRLVVPIGTKLFRWLPGKWQKTLNFHVGERFRASEENQGAVELKSASARTPSA